MRELFEEKGDLIRVIVVGVLFAAALVVFHFVGAEWYIMLAVYLVLYFAVGYEIIFSAIKNVIKEPFNENFLMLVASVGAFALGEYPEAVAIMLFFSVGELFEDYADKKSERAIEKLYDMIADRATVIVDGKHFTVDVDSVKEGDILLVRTGERIAVDGVVLSGETFIDASMITGESTPTRVCAGESVMSGSTVSGAPVTIKAIKKAEDSSAAKIIGLIKETEEKKAKSEKFITHFARVYTPVVILSALLVAFLPLAFGQELSVWAYRAINLLVISCPCALVVSVPIAFFAGVGKAFENGVIIKGSSALERVNAVNIFAFDKTGTLTRGEFSVLGVYPEDKKEELLKVAASLGVYSSHPIANAIVGAYGGERYSADGVSEIAGRGLSGFINGEKALVGNAELLKSEGIEPPVTEPDGTTTFVFYKDLIGAILVGDGLKENSKKLVENLKKCGNKSIMLTGDNGSSAKKVAEELSLDGYYSSLLPKDKLDIISELKKTGRVCFVGDGINDSPALKQADLSVAMGSGSDIAADCSDVVIVSGDPLKIVTLKKISKKTMAIVYTNVIGSIAVKAAIFALSVSGLAPLWLAVFADVGVMILAVLNSLRLSSAKKLTAKV